MVVVGHFLEQDTAQDWESGQWRDSNASRQNTKIAQPHPAEAEDKALRDVTV
jgi:hypothetical protein